MPDEPAFPSPRPEVSVYRQASGGPAPDAPRARRIVTRPEPPGTAGGERESPRHDAPDAAERLARRRRLFVVRRPRASAAALLGVGLVALIPRALEGLGDQPVPGASASFGGAVLVGVGLWVLGAGLPLRADGEPRGWWTAGLAASATAAALAHMALISLAS